MDGQLDEGFNVHAVMDAAVREDNAETKREITKAEVATNLLAGLTTSFAAIALGAAFGVSSGRGALVGILSAGTIALITGLLGGTRVQCSGPTAPMTTVTTVFVSYSRAELLQPGTLSPAAWGDTHPDNCTAPDGTYAPEGCPLPDHFCNIVMLLGACFIALMGATGLGPLIRKVPTVVISGFMNGIAVQIWWGQLKKLIGFAGTSAMVGSTWINWLVTFTTTASTFLLPRLMRATLPPKLAKSMPATLIVIGLMTLCTLGVEECAEPEAVDCIEKTKLGATIRSVDDVQRLVAAQIPGPTLWSWELTWLALPFALQLAVLCYLDTLLTSLVVDKMVQERDDSKEETNKSKELAAQGLANATVAAFGGLPGAQATIRSVLILKEGGTLRLAGTAAGVFVMIEMLIFQDLVKHIPAAVFCGVLFKVGYDVFDFEASAATPFLLCLSEASRSGCAAVHPLRQGGGRGADRRPSDDGGAAAPLLQRGPRSRHGCGLERRRRRRAGRLQVRRPRAGQGPPVRDRARRPRLQRRAAGRGGAGTAAGGGAAGGAGEGGGAEPGGAAGQGAEEEPEGGGRGGGRRAGG